MAVEGQTAIGPNGERAVFQGGQWVVLGPAQMPPADPTFPYQGSRAAADAASAQAGAAVDTATTQAQIDESVARAVRMQRAGQTEGLDSGYMWNESGTEAVPIPGYTAGKEYSDVQRADMIKAFNRALDLDKQIDRLRDLYESGPGRTSGLAGAADYAPLTRNRRFDEAGNATRAMIRDVLGFTGTELNTPIEIEMNIGAYIPKSTDRDDVIEDKLVQLEAVRDSRLRGIAATLGGFPDPQGRIVPIPEGEPPNAMTAKRIISGQGATAAQRGATEQSLPIPPEMQEAHARYLAENWGNITPEGYTQFREALDQQFGFGSRPDAYAAIAPQLNERAAAGGSPEGLPIPSVNAPLEGFGGLRHDIAANPFGAAAIGAADMGSFGAVSALAPNQMQALAEQQPLGTTLGQVGGAISGTALLGRLGRETLGRAAPSLLGGRGGAQIGRNLATDAAYSGIYGGVTGEDPLLSAGLGAAGSAGGQLVGRGLGRIVGGFDTTPAAQRLGDRGIPLTVAQRVGGMARDVEDRASSIPLVGDMIRRRRMEGVDAFNRQAFAEAGAPIGATTRDIGEDGIQSLRSQVGRAYDDATAGTNVPFDQQFADDFQGAVMQGMGLPVDLRRGLGEVLDARIAPLTDVGSMTGDQFQQAMRALRETRNKPPQRFQGFEQNYRNAVTAAMDALEGQMMRGAPEVAPALRAANAANRNVGSLDRAVQSAAGGSQSGEAFTFTPNQLQRAGQSTQRRYPGPRPMGDLADDAQRVLPSRVPDSGTAGRLASMALPTAVIGGGAALAQGDLTGGLGTGATATGITGALLALGGTRVGQRALSRAMLDRPESIRRAGRFIGDRSGYLGSATVPLMIAP